MKGTDKKETGPLVIKAEDLSLRGTEDYCLLQRPLLNSIFFFAPLSFSAHVEKQVCGVHPIFASFEHEKIASGETEPSPRRSTPDPR